MFNHEPKNYDCPICKLVKHQDDEINKTDFIVYEDKTTMAYVSPLWWVNNPGNVMVVPKEHVENIYNISDELLGDVYKTAKKIAIAIRKSYPSDGISTRQHNEPGGGQEVWHLHVHVFPRYAGDRLYQNQDNYEWVSAEKRMHFVNLLKKYFSGD